MNRIAGIASIPSRAESLVLVVNSLLPQVDKVYVALNGYREIPEPLRNLRYVECEILDNSLGDSAKFLHADIPDAVYFGCDDDLLYPMGYCDYLQNGIEKYNGLVSLHGRSYLKGAGFKQWAGNYRCLNTVSQDVKVNFVGSGVCCFNTNRLKVHISDFKTKNMSDCYLSRLAFQQGVPMVVLAHQRDYLTYLHPKDTIWQQMRDVSVQSSILRSYIK
jgi:hypothetical protein